MNMIWIVKIKIVIQTLGEPNLCVMICKSHKKIYTKILLSPSSNKCSQLLKFVTKEMDNFTYVTSNYFIGK